MKKALRVYGQMLRLVRTLPQDTRPYYSKYVRENFANYKDFDPNSDPEAFDELFQRAYKHSLWILNKYHLENSVADKLKEACDA